MSTKLRIITALFIVVAQSACAITNDAKFEQDKLYLKLFSKLIVLENDYLLSLSEEGEVHFITQLDKREEKGLTNFYLGKVKPKKIEEWNSALETLKGRKANTCGLDIYILKKEANYEYAVLSDGKEFIAVGSSNSEFRDWITQFNCHWGAK